MEGAVTPGRMPVADATHAEGEHLLDFHLHLALDRIMEREPRSFDFSPSGFPIEFVIDVAALPHTRVAVRRCAWRDAVEDKCVLEPAAAVFVLMKSQVSESVSEMHWRPE